MWVEDSATGDDMDVWRQKCSVALDESLDDWKEGCAAESAASRGWWLVGFGAAGRVEGVLEECVGGVGEDDSVNLVMVEEMDELVVGRGWVVGGKFDPERSVVDVADGGEDVLEGLYGLELSESGCVG